jgi:hypothetical protein
MRFNLFAVRNLGLILLVPVCLSATGCAMYRGDLVQRSNTAAVATTGAVEVTPAVLVQNGSGPAVVSAGQPQQTTNLDKLPPLPKGDVAPSEPTKLLSAEEKARVIAELEALARQPAAATAPVKTDCKVASTDKSGVAQSAAAATSCSSSPKPALRP